MFFREFLLKSQIEITKSKLYTWGLNTSGQLGLGYSTNPALSYAQLEAGNSHMLAIASNGYLYAWGQNTAGQLGTGDTVTRSSPIQIGFNVWSRISAGNSHSLGVTGDGRLFAWGLNSSFQLGTTDSLNRSSPVFIGVSGTSWNSVTAGTDHSLATDLYNILYGWGSNSIGQLGDGTTISKSSPTQIGTSSWNQVSAGNSFTLGIDSNNVLYGWGLNTSSQLGDATITNQNSPIQVGIGYSWNSVSAGFQHTAAIRSDSTLWTWGNSNSVLLFGNLTYSWSLISQSGTASHTAAVRSDGTLWTWGLNNAGQLGDNSTLNKSSPVLIGVSSWTAVSTGASYTLAIDTNNNIFGWGLNSSSQLGDGNSINRSSPVLVAGGYSKISAGADHSLAIANDGSLWGFGNNNAGQITTTSATTVFSWTQIASNSNHVLAIRSDNRLFGWGLNNAGQIGDTSTVSKSSPILIGSLSTWSDIKVGLSHSVGLAGTNLYVWGLNNSGQLGLNNTSNVLSPTLLTGSWSSITAGSSHTAAINSSGQVYSWGNNSNYQLGDNTSINKSSPVLLSSTSSFTAIAAGLNFTIGIDTTNQLNAWGYNIAGDYKWSWSQVKSGAFLNTLALRSDGTLWTMGDGGGVLGLNDTIGRSYPTQIGTQNNWVFIESSSNNPSYNGAAINSLGELYIWGDNRYGQLGQGDTIFRSSPVQVAGSWSTVSINTHVIALTTDYRMFAWGNNNQAQAGRTSIFTTVLSPIQVGAGSSWIQALAGEGSSSVALKDDGTLWWWGFGPNAPAYGYSSAGVNRSFPVAADAGGGGVTSYTQIAGAGAFFALDFENKLYSWGGWNNSYVLGFDSLVRRSRPTLLMSGASFTQIKANKDGASALSPTGDLYQWGQWAVPSSGGIIYSSPVLISSGFSQSTYLWPTFYILPNGNMFLYGYNFNGQLGLNDTISRSSPTLISSGTTFNKPVQIAAGSWSIISAGNDTLAAIDNTSKLYMWGVTNTSGQLGTNDTVMRSIPTQIGTDSWANVSVGQSNTFAKTSTGLLFGWGANSTGDLGLNDSITRSSPTQIGSSSWTLVSNSSGTINSVIYIWGTNATGRLGNFSTINRSSPVILGNLTLPANIPNPISINSWNAISAGASYSTAIDTAARLYTWGLNSGYQLGQNDTINRSSPIQISGSWSKISAGFNHNLAINTNYKLYTWGVATAINLTTETQSWQQVAASSGGHTLAIRNDNLLYAWGLNNVGQLGTGDTLNRSSPVLIGTSSWTSVSTGSSHTLAILSDGRLFAWGLNGLNQLGDTTSINKSSPVLISSSSWKQVAGGTDHSLAIANDNTLYAWGNNNVGQAAPAGNTITYSWSKVSSDRSTTIAIRSDNRLFGWGLNNAGQLGDNGTINKSSPVQIGSDASWTQISVGTSFALGINNSLLYAWGLNNAGQLGDNTVANKSNPTQIGSSSWTQISAGNSFSVGLTSTNKLFTWGLNSTYQLGDNSSINKSSPVAIGSSSWSVISAGFDHTYGITSVNTLYGWGNNTNNLVDQNTFYDPAYVSGSSNDTTFFIRGDGAIVGSGFNNWGQLGQNDVINRSTFVVVSSDRSYVQVDTNGNTVFAIDTLGRLWGWGRNASWELGNNSSISRSSPIQLNAGTSYSMVSMGFITAYAIRNDGALFGWGDGRYIGQNSTIFRSSPVQVGTSSWTLIRANGSLSVAGITTTNNAYVWGFNGPAYDLGVGTVQGNRSSPVLLAASISDIQIGSQGGLYITTGGDVSVWGDFSTINSTVNRATPGSIGTGYIKIFGNPSYGPRVVQKSDNTIWAWGQPWQSFGTNSSVIYSSPVQIDSGTWSFFQAVSQFNAGPGIGIKNTTGDAYVWGNNTYGAQGQGDTLARSSATLVGTANTPLTYRSNPTLVVSGSWNAVSAGTSYSLSIDSTNKLYSWGVNNVGQLGQNDTITRSSPTLVGTSSWTSVTAGSSSSLAIRSGGSLFAWGLNSTGELGTSDTVNRSSPVQIGSSSWTSVGSGTGSSAILSNNKLYIWGNNAQGAIGDNTTVNKNSPVILGNLPFAAGAPIQIGSSQWTSVSAGGSVSMAIDGLSRLYGWGLNTTGQLGINDSINRSSPVVIGTSSWTQVSAGSNHVAAITILGALFAWGGNAVGQLGLTNINAGGDTVTRSSPVQVGTSSWTSVSAGTSNTIAVRYDGSTFAWGLNNIGQLGNNDTLNRSSPVVIGSIVTYPSWTFLSSNKYGHMLGIRSDSVLYAWGLNNAGQLGDNTTITRSSPVLISASTSWTSVSVGKSFSLALDSTSKMYAWGLNTGYQLGDGTTINRSTPVNISYPSGASPYENAATSFSQISAGDSHSLAISANTWNTNQLWAWGNNSLNQASGRFATIYQTVDTNSTGAAAIDIFGRLLVWGYVENNTGTTYLGGVPNNSTLPQPYPDYIPTTNVDWQMVSMGINNGGGITVDNKLWTWGSAGFGQLMLNSVLDRSSEQQVTGSWTMVAFSVTGDNSYAIRTNGSLWGAGYDFYRQIGNGGISASSPVQISAGNSFVSVSAGQNTMYAIDTIGRIIVYGWDDVGQAGTNNPGANKQNATITGSWSQVSAGGKHVWGIRTDGTLWAWGRNDTGQLGLNDTLNRSSPIQVGSASDWTFINAKGGIAGNSNRDYYYWGVSSQYFNSDTIVRSSPTLLYSSSNYTKITGGPFTYHLLTDYGYLYGTGRNTIGNAFQYGMVGDNTAITKSSPVLINQAGGSISTDNPSLLSYPAQIGLNVGVSSWTAISAGSRASLAISSNNKLFVWGLNDAGQLGNDTNGNLSQMMQIGNSSWSAVAAGDSNTLAIRADGGLFTWGLNNVGQLGDNTTINKSSPIQIGTSSWTSVAAGLSTNYAILSTGALYGWGLNSTGQVGDNSTINKSNPVQIGTSSWTQINGGAARTTVSVGFVWGLNSSGQLAQQDTLNRSSLVQVTAEGGIAAYNSVRAGSSYTTAITTNNMLFTWGLNSTGQLGTVSTVNRSSPTQLNATPILNNLYPVPTKVGDSSWTQIQAGTSFSLAVRSDSGIFVWGLNTSGQLGDNSSITKSSPTQIGNSSWTAIGGGALGGYALRTDSLLFAWGSGSVGQTGQLDTINRSNPTILQSTAGVITATGSPIQVTTSSYTQIAAGASFTTARTVDNKLIVWGLNSTGQLGLTDTITRSSPTQVGNSSWSFISAGTGFAAHVDSLNNVYSVGNNAAGALGDGTAANKSSPTIVTGSLFTGASAPMQVGFLSWTSVSVGSTHTAAIRSDNTLWVWGVNTVGQVGDNTAITKSSPVQIGSSSWQVVGVTKFGNVSLAIRSDNSLWAWGDNAPGIITNTVSNSWITMDTGNGHVAAIRSDYTMWTWGLNANGQLGIGLTTSRSSPTQVTSVSGSWVAVATGSSHTVGILSDGTMYAWGYNNVFQLGDGTNTNKSAPVQVFGGHSWSQVSAGYSTTFGLRSDGIGMTWGDPSFGWLGNGDGVARSVPSLLASGFATTSWSYIHMSDIAGAIRASDSNLFTWGRNAAGGIGDNTTVNKSVPTNVPGTWQYFASAQGTSYGIRTNGSLWAWGSNASGMLGNNASGVNQSSPVAVTSTLSWIQVYGDKFAGGGVFALSNFTYQLFGWGPAGSLIDNTTVSRSVPTAVTAANLGAVLGSRFYRVAYGGGVVDVLRDNGSLYAYGSNSDGRIGNNSVTTPQTTAVLLGTTITAVSSPVQVGLSTDWVKVDAGLSTAAAINSTGKLYTWGLGTSGQLGDTTVISANFPVQIGNSSWTQVSVGASHMLAIRSDGILFAWGLNTSAQLGDLTTANKSSPTQIGNSSWTQVSAGWDHSLAVRSDGTLWTWGLGTSGQLGVITEAYSWTQVAFGDSHTVAIRSDSTLWGWGNNATGQLGILDTLARSSPTQIGSSSWSQVAAKGGTTLALRVDSILFAWGNNTASFILGIGDSLNRSSPVQVSTSSWTAIAAGTTHAMAISTDGTLWGWGATASLYSSTAPLSWITVSESVSHTAAIRTDGLLFTWGLGTGGILGDGSTVSKSSPVQIGSSSWSAVSSGNSHTLAIDATGRLFAWGVNTFYQLGDNTTANRSSPVLIDSGSWIAVSAGVNYSMAIKYDNTLYAWGLGTTGQLGTLTETQSWNAISASNGGTFSLAIRNDGKLFAWGTNAQGQLSDGLTVSRSSPVIATGSVSFTAISAGASHTVALGDNLNVYTAGLAIGLGQNDTLNRSNPTLVSTLSNIVQVAAGVSHTGAVNSTYNAFTWGLNSSRQLGIANDSINRSTPVQIGTTISWTQLSLGSISGAGLDALGNAYVWGTNTNGILGLNDTLTRSDVTQVLSGTSFTQISHGASHTLAIRNDGALVVWGLGTSGQLGTGIAITRSSPTVVGSNSWTQVSAGVDHSMAIRNDNTLWGFGSNLVGQVGVVTDVYSWTQLSLSGSHRLAIRNDGLLFAWGTNAGGQLGTNDTISRSSPTQIGTDSWTSVSAGTSFSLAVNTLGQLFAWGLATSNQLGVNNRTNRSSPIQVGTNSWSVINAGFDHSVGIDTANRLYAWGNDQSIGNNLIVYSWTFVDSSVGGSNTLAIRSDGLLYSWGRNNEAQLGTGDTITRSSPTLIGTDSWTQVAIGTVHSLGIKTDGTLWSWGTNDQGQLGIDLTTNRSNPVQIGSNTNWTSVSATDRNSYAIDSTGKLYSWGGNSVGQLGDSTTINKSSPIQIGSSSWTLISSGGSFSGADQFAIAIRSDGTLFAWGRNNLNQLGNGNQFNQSSPIQIGTNSWLQVDAGINHSVGIDVNFGLYTWGNPSAILLQKEIGPQTRSWTVIEGSNDNLFHAAIRSDGLLFSWGLNSGGQLGLGDTILRSSPVIVVSGQNSWTSISVGSTHMVAVRNDGTLWSWGNNAFGQLGDSTTVNKSFPTQIGSINTWSKGNAGDNFSLAIDSTGSLYAWGANATGQLGTNNTISYSSPIQIGTDSWTLASTGGAAGANQWVLAIASDSTLWSWGNNAVGQLGQTSTITRSSPIQIGTNSWTNINAGAAHNLAIDINSKLWSWGQNNAGQLGLNDILNRSSPTQIGNSNWTAINAGLSYSHGINSVGQLFGWGLNSSGNFYIGNGLTTNRSSPVQVTVGTSFKAVGGSSANAFAIRSDDILFGWGQSPYTGFNDNGVNRSVPAIISPQPQVFVGMQIPTNVNVATLSWSKASAGGSFSHAIDSTGKLWAWGISGGSFQLGDNTSITRSSPVQISVGNSFTSISSGAVNAFAIATTNLLYGWGSAGTNGDGNNASNQSRPVIVAPLSQFFALANPFTGSGVIPTQIGTSSWTTVSAGQSYTTAIRLDGGLFTWGQNSVGQLGTNQTVTRSSPTQVGTSSWSQVSAGDFHTLIISSAGNLFATGSNASGQIGDNSLTNRSSPVLVSSGGWTSIAAGYTHSVGVQSSRLYAWGLGTSGQLGTNDALSRSNPTQISSLSNWTTIAAGSLTSGAINNLNILYMWGASTTGDGTTINKSSPTQIGGNNEINTLSPVQIAGSWTSVSAGTSFTLAKDTNGTIYAWGQDSSGQLGI